MTQQCGFGQLWEGAQRRRSHCLCFLLSPGKAAGLEKVAICSTRIWNNLYFSPFQHGWPGRKELSLASDSVRVRRDSPTPKSCAIPLCPWVCLLKVTIYPNFRVIMFSLSLHLSFPLSFSVMLSFWQIQQIDNPFAAKIQSLCACWLFLMNGLKPQLLCALEQKELNKWCVSTLHIVKITNSSVAGYCHISDSGVVAQFTLLHNHCTHSPDRVLQLFV